MNIYSIDYYISIGLSPEEALFKVEKNKLKVSNGIKTRKRKDRYEKYFPNGEISFEEYTSYENKISTYIKSRDRSMDILKAFIIDRKFSFDEAIEHIFDCCLHFSDKYKKLLRSKEFLIMLFGVDSKEYQNFKNECKTLYSTCSFEKFSKDYEDKDQARKDFNIKYGSLNIENIMNKNNCSEEEALKIREKRIYTKRCTEENKPREERQKINKSKALTLENFIRKYGPELGKIHYERIRDIRRKTGTLEYYVKKYGEKEGLNRFKKEKQNTHWTIDFWIEKGYDEEQARNKLNKIFMERPSFSKKYCVGKYGYKRGIQIWKRRQELWQKSLYSGLSSEEKKKFEKSKGLTLENQIKKYGKDEGRKRYIEVIEKRNQTGGIYTSKESKIFFVKLYKELRKLGLIEKKEPFFGVSGSKERFIYSKKDKRLFFYDFCIEKYKIIVEYHGTFFHPREDLEWNPVFSGQSETKEEGIQNDMHKEKLARDGGYEYLIVWSDSDKDFETYRIMNAIIERYEFLNGKN